MLSDVIQKRIAELTAHQGEIQARADKEKAAVQVQINALIDADAALAKDPTIETVYLKLAQLKLLPQQE